jgi:hypothetical protein
MNESSWGADVEAESAYAVYDSKTGRIVHLHQVTVHRGGEAHPAEKNQAQALELARRHGHTDVELEALEISPSDLKGPVPRHVDLASRKLKTVDAD